MSDRIITMLTNARQTIENGWCQKYWAKDQYGNETTLERGISFCIMGALYKHGYCSFDNKEVKNLFNTMNNIIEKYFNLSVTVIQFNDYENTKKEDIISLINKTINHYS